MQNTRARLWVFIVYVIFITILFTLPGTAFPTDDWMSKIWFDKWVHLGIFFLFAILFALLFKEVGRREWLVIFLTAAVYGLLVEWMQENWISNRSFDIGDWIADMGGTAFGLWFFGRYPKK